MDRYRVSRLSLLTLVAFVALPMLARAENPQTVAEQQPKDQQPKLCPFCAAALKKDARYDEKAGNTLVRGAINLGFGWTEMITQPAKEAQNGGNIFAGMANGIGRGINRTFAGLGEVLTFWTPKVDGQYVHFIKDCPLDNNGK